MSLLEHEDGAKLHHLTNITSVESVIK